MDCMQELSALQEVAIVLYQSWKTNVCMAAAAKTILQVPYSNVEPLAHVVLHTGVLCALQALR
jgi:hypothetical protein